MKSPYPIRVLLLIIALTISACTGLPEIQAPPAPEEASLVSSAANDNPAVLDQYLGPGASLPERPTGIADPADVPPPITGDTSHPGTEGENAPRVEVHSPESPSTQSDADLPPTGSDPVPTPDGMNFIVNTTDDTDGTCDGQCSLREAIRAANGNPGLDIIAFDIPGDPPYTIRPDSALPYITDPVIIDGWTQLGSPGPPVVELDGSNTGPGASGLRIGTSAGNSAVRGLVINNFGGNGILIYALTGTVIQGNYIGTDITGSLDQGNAYSGIRIWSVTDALIGGTNPGESNVIAFNGDKGIDIYQLSDTPRILGNAIYANGELGIDRNTYDDEGVSLDYLGATLTGAAGDGSTTITLQGALSATPDTSYRLEFFSNSACDPSFYGEGETYLGYSDISTDASGNATVNTTLPLGVPAGYYITTTLTNATEGTSEFSRCEIAVTGIPPAPTLVSPVLITTPAAPTYIWTPVTNAALYTLWVDGPSGNVVAEIYDELDICTDTLCSAIPSVPLAEDGAYTWKVQASNDFGAGPWSATSAFTVDTALVSILMVNTTDDGDDACYSAHCSLREAINAANGTPGLDTIAFDLPGIAPYTIQPDSALPEITDPVIIDGWTQPNYSGSPIVELDGSNAGLDVSGLEISAGDSVVRGLVINNFDKNGISLTSNNNVIEGNYVGTDTSGTVAAGNRHGIDLDGAHYNTIGGTTAQARNLISGNRHRGLYLDSSTFNTIQGNFIGTDADGTAALGGNSWAGFRLVNGSDNNLIGGTSAGAGNLISGNDSGGIYIYDDSNLVQGNLIGTDVTGAQDLGNGGCGIFSSGLDNVIGGATPEARNIISGNSCGISIDSNSSALTGTVVQGNYIGTDITGSLDLGNASYGIYISDVTDALIGGTNPGEGNVIAFNGGTGITIRNLSDTPRILGNAIYANGGLGIDRRNGYYDDSLDHLGATLTGAAGDGSTTITLQGALSATPDTSYRLEFFSNSACDPSFYGEGETYLGYSDISTDASGDATVNTTLPLGVPAGYYITTTLTNTTEGTSEFSRCEIAVTGIPPATTLVSPVSIATPPAAPTYIWTPVTNADLYTLWVDGPSGNVVAEIYNALEICTDTLCSVTPSVLLVEDGTYTWKVQASNTLGDGPWSATSAFTVDTALVNILTVNTTDDTDGTCDEAHCSLREAINAANGHSGLDIIEFDILGGGPYTIQPASALPEITDLVIIDGWTQSGFSGSPIVELDGSNAGLDVSGLEISGGYSTVRGLVINNFDKDGIFLTSNNNVIEGNYVGTDTSGTAAAGNRYGIYLDGAHYNTIGGTTAQARNLISGNQSSGLYLSSSTFNTIQGNFIGTDAGGTAALGNSAGIGLVNGSDNNLIGGTSAGAGNLISGNDNYGMYIYDDSNLIQGNLIGTDVTGTQDLGNGYEGIHLRGLDNVIGGATPEARNIISGNDNSGIAIFFDALTGTVVQGNYIGTDITGSLDLGNAYSGIRISDVTDALIGGTNPGEGNVIAFNSDKGIRIYDLTDTPRILGNAIYANEELGIDRMNGLYDEGVSLDYLGATLTGATGDGSTTITLQGALSATPDTSYRLEFFSNSACDPSFYGEGETYLGYSDISTDASGDATVNTTLPLGVPAGYYITTTLTNTTEGTSEFSRCEIAVTGIPPAPTLVSPVLITTPAAPTYIWTPVANAALYTLWVDGPSGNVVAEIYDELDICTDTLCSVIPSVPLAEDGAYTWKVQASNGSGAGPWSATSAFTVDTALVNILVVNTTDDDDDTLCHGAHCSLREAINASNATPGTDEIHFDIPGDGPHSILILEALPYITDPVVIDGTTEPDFADKPVIEIMSTGAIDNMRSLYFQAGDSTLRGIALHSFERGIVLEGGNSVIEGCYLGTDLSGTILKGFAHTVALSVSSSNNRIGGATPGAANIIADGMRIDYGTGNVVQGNYIGTNPDGTATFGGGMGVLIGFETQDNLIGGTGPGEGNVIANFNWGIYNVWDLYDNTGHAFLGNSITSNSRGGISLHGGINPLVNDPGDVDAGPNNQQNYPVLDSAIVTTETTITGTLNSTPNTTFHLEFFDNSVCHASTYGEGETYLGFINVTTDSNGDVSFTFVTPALIPPNHYITATATDSGNNTSEFSRCQLVIDALPEATTLISPDGEAAPLYPIYTWANIAGAEQYYLWVDGPAGHVFDQWLDALDVCVDGVCTLTPELPLAHGETYTWKVQTANSLGNGPWSATATFSVDQLVYNTLVVNTTYNDSGICTAAYCEFTAAVELANGRPGKDVIAFDIPGEGPHNITIDFEPIDITDSIIIDGTTEPGYDDSPVIQLTYGEVLPPEPGYPITLRGDDSIIRGLSLIGFETAIEVIDADGILIEGNLIGIPIVVPPPSPGPDGMCGIHIDDSTNTLVGGVIPGAGNQIANYYRGICISGSSSTGNRLSGNEITDSYYAIDLGSYGVTPNDPGDGDTGPNNLQNFPLITFATTPNIAISGTLNSMPDTTYRIEFFDNTICSASGYGNGETYLGYADVTTDSGGNVTFLASFPDNVPIGHFITATATDPNGNTSEFSACQEVTALNDSPADAWSITTNPYQILLNTSTATTGADDPVLPCGPADQGSHSVWYTFTPAGDGLLTLDTFGSDYNTVLSVWTGSPGSFQNEACNDDAAGGQQSQLQVPVSGGTTYYIEVVGYGAADYGLLDFTASLTLCYALSATVGQAGAGSVSTDLPPNCGDGVHYLEGTQVEVTATANTGYVFANWSGDASGSNNPLTLIVDNDISITANFTEVCYAVNAGASHAERGMVSLSPAPTCSDGIRYREGTQVDITATANTGYAFTGWSGDVTGTDNPWTVYVSDDQNITANFAEVCFSLTATDNPPGDGAVIVNTPPNCSDGVRYLEGTSVEMTADPATGFEFDTWSGDASGTDNPLTITMDADKTITANFTVACYALTTTAIPSEAGVFSANPAPNCHETEYTHGTVVELTITPNTGYHFDSWGGDAGGSENPLSITMDGDKTITANFLNCYTLSVVADPAGGGHVRVVQEPNCGANQYIEGSEVTLTAQASIGYLFSGWSGDGSGMWSPLTVIMDGDKSITALFSVHLTPVDEVTINVGDAGPTTVEVVISGHLPDSCTRIHRVDQSRTGNLVEVQVISRRPSDKACAQVTVPYSITITLEGEYPPGDYVLVINGVEYAFSVT